MVDLKKRYAYCLVVILLAFSSVVSALTCKMLHGSPGQVIIPKPVRLMVDFGQIVVPDGLPLGGVIVSRLAGGPFDYTGSGSAYKCNGSELLTAINTIGLGVAASPAGGWPAGYDNHVNPVNGFPGVGPADMNYAANFAVTGMTNVPGIGVRIRMAGSRFGVTVSTVFNVDASGIGYGAGSVGAPIVASAYDYYGPQITSGSAGLGGWTVLLNGNGGGPNMVGYVVELIKTGTSPGGVLTGPAYSIKANGVIDFEIDFGPTTIIGNKGCVVDSSSAALNVDMGQVGALAFSGVGSLSEAKTFNIQLSNCQVGTTVNMRLDGTQVSTLPGVLGLTPSSEQTQVAAGVGIQMQMNGVPVTLNTPFLVQASAPAGQLSIPLTARYIQIGNVAPGQANAVVAFAMSYQ